MKPADPKAWEELKTKGEQHYKTGEIEPVDLYLAGDMLRDFAIGNIIKYAYRNRTDYHDGGAHPLNMNDLAKIKHYVDMLMVAFGPCCGPYPEKKIFENGGFVGLRARP